MPRGPVKWLDKKEEEKGLQWKGARVIIKEGSDNHRDIPELFGSMWKVFQGLPHRNSLESP